MVDKTIKIKEEEYKKLQDYKLKTSIPFWRQIKDALELKEGKNEN